jgi:hypothetical protein
VVHDVGLVHALEFLPYQEQPSLVT